MIKIKQKGIILSADEFMKPQIGWYIYIEPSSEEENTSYYIYYENPENLEEGYDAWVENYEKLEEFFEVDELKVKWLEENSRKNTGK